MGYLVNQARVATLTINGADYTSNLIQWVVSDSSAVSSGLISTSGSMSLQGIPGGALMQDYDRNNFKRGAEVILSLKKQDGNVVRHPRGLLYVVSMVYDPETETLTVSLGCRIALAVLNSDTSALLSFAPISLDITQQTVQGVGGSLNAAGMYLFQDNTGALVSGKVFGTDGPVSTEPGDWTSVLGLTAVSVKPLAGAEIVPDTVSVSYQTPSSYSGGASNVDIVTTDSNYFLTYPASKYERTGNGLSSITGISQGTTVDPAFGGGSSCGNAPPPPAGSQVQPACNEGYSLSTSPAILPAASRQIQRTEYNGPAGQVSRVYTERRGPAVEVNSQYYADKFAYCRHTWSTKCNPNGSCPMDGMNQILQTYSSTLYYYGSANELVKTVQDNYATTLSGAQSFDWRAGTVNGAPQSFTNLSTDTMYRVSRIENTYSQQGDSNVQETTTYTSTTSRQSGIKAGSIDALQGIKTSERRVSTTISTAPIAPDNTVSPTTRTVVSSSDFVLFNDQFTSPPSEAGPNVRQAQAPVAFLVNSQAEADDAILSYGRFLQQVIKGESRGLQIGEALRDEIIDNWHPGMPFRYAHDRSGTANDKILAMRMDATTWGVSTTETGMVTNGLWVGFSDGSLAGGDNLLGNSVLETDGSITPPTTPSGPPVVVNETFVDTGSYAFSIDVNLSLSSSTAPLVENITYLPAAESTTYDHYETFTVWVDGFVISAGGLLAPGQGGSMPLENGGDLITDGATVIIGDVFDQS